MSHERRNMANSDVYYTKNTPAVWTVWNLKKLVNEGYKINPWVFRAVRAIAQSASTVPWVVYDSEMTPQWDHPLSKTLNKPHPHFTRQQLVEMLVSWLELSGRAYIKKVRVGGRTQELWPVSPDRLAPVPSSDPAKFIDGYMIVNERGEQVKDPEYNEETVMYIRFINPSNPYEGISPLEAAAKSVDLDNSQIDWNTATMQNRGVVDGVFTFKRALDRPQADSILERIMEKFSSKSNARKPLVIGDEATYQRLALSPTEMDFLDSRKNNREEILSVFGVPPQLVGVQDSSTYNNFAVSLRIFWEVTVIPILDTLRDTFNHSFADELSDGLTVGYDTSGVAALRESETEKASTAKIYTDMGVPVSIVNEKMELGLTEYEGWDQSRGASSSPPGNPPAGSQRSFKLVPFEQRNADEEIKLRDGMADGIVNKLIGALLSKQADAVFAALSGGDVMDAIAEFDDQWDKLLERIYLQVGVAMGKQVVAPKRATWAELEKRAGDQYAAELLKQMKAVLDQEEVILKERSLIQEATAQYIVEQTLYGLNNQWTVEQIKQAITDTGVFSPERALRIARTVSGTASSMGQMAAGEGAGATHKKWLTSLAHVRQAHMARNGEVVPMSSRFSAQVGSVGPRYPLDPSVAAADRINCRCFMTFEYRKGYKEPAPAEDISTDTVVTEQQPVSPNAKALLDYKLGKLTDALAKLDTVTQEGLRHLTTEQIDAIKEYSKSGYKSLNELLRTGVGDNTASDERLRNLLDAAFARPEFTVQKSVTVYRGIDLSTFVSGTDDPSSLTGSVFEDKGFMSTTTQKSTAVGFSSTEGQPTVIRATAKPGTAALYMPRLSSVSRDESELLLNRGTKFRVGKITTEQWKIDGELFDVTVVDAVLL